MKRKKKTHTLDGHSQSPQVSVRTKYLSREYEFFGLSTIWNFNWTVVCACVCIACDCIWVWLPVCMCVRASEWATKREWWNAFFTLLKWNVKRKRWTHTQEYMKWWFCEGKVIKALHCKQTIPEYKQSLRLLRENLSEGFECICLCVNHIHLKYIQAFDRIRWTNTIQNKRSSECGTKTNHRLVYKDHRCVSGAGRDR